MCNWDECPFMGKVCDRCPYREEDLGVSLSLLQLSGRDVCPATEDP